jgi:serine protease Do
VTNNHVVDKANSVEITTDDGKTHTAKVIGSDPRTDLALIKVAGRTDFPFAKLSDTKPRIGDWVLAVGNPFGLGGTVTAGIVSARGRDIQAGPYDDFLQLDAPINQGNSGGPSFNMDGEVIGVNTAIYSPSGGSIGIGFAIPSNLARRIVADLARTGRIERAWLGINVQNLTPEIATSLGLKSDADGVLIAAVEADSPAARGGLRQGDVIVAVNGKRVDQVRDVPRTIAAFKPGTRVMLTLLRRGREVEVPVTTGRLPN